MSSISLYKFEGDRKQLNKDINHGSTLLETVSGNFRGAVNLINPVIEITPTQTSTITVLTTQCNYVYITDLGRYYFVDDMICKVGDVIELHLSLDVLYSWSTQILALDQGIVARNGEAANSNLFLDDSEIHVYNNPHVVTYTFTYAQGSLTFGNPAYVLAVAGS